MPTSGCGDDAVGTSAGSGSGTAAGSSDSDTGPVTTGVGSTGTDEGSGGGSDQSTDEGSNTDEGSDSDTGSGEMADPGHAATAFVNAGNVSTSPNYQLIWSFGQETQNQNLMDSASFTLHGGLIGASQ